jgi:hypothetical protein
MSFHFTHSYGLWQYEMARAVICFPRLDMSFKEGPIPIKRGPPNHPIRYHWIDFEQNLTNWHYSQKDDCTVVEKPLWEFTEEYVKDLSSRYDVVYMPHKQRNHFKSEDNVRFYMQTVFPWLFTIDKQGWGANLSWAPLQIIEGREDPSLWDFLKQYIAENRSKFAQPHKTVFSLDDFVLFSCQIPHDETIKFHSEISVLEGLRHTLEYFKDKDQKVVVKGHPMNPGSMSELRELTSRYHNAFWVEDVSIHVLMEKCKAFFTVNSGSGIEAMLHEKKIFTFGRSEYQSVVCNIPAIETQKCLDVAWNSNYLPISSIVQGYKYFVSQYFEKCFNSQNESTFEKLKDL